jgi:secreted trypsin-like serine protease
MSFRRVARLALFLLVVALAAVPVAAAAPRITNGAKAPDALYDSHLRPLVALISLDATSQYDGQFCAGTLIDDTHVLTAGHCIVEDGNLRTRISPSSVAVLAGARTLSISTLDRANLVPVTAIFVNPYFNIRTMRWDAAVLRLARPITSVPTMQRLTGDEGAALGLGTTEVPATVGGWGDTDPNVDDCCFPQELQSADVPVQTDATCNGNLVNAPYLSFSSEFQLCAGRLQGGGHLGTDTCQGDSGGPLIVDVAGAPRLAGVTSFGVGCGQKFFGVYARLSALQSWIDSIPGIVAGDPRDPSHGPGDLAAPTATGSPVDYGHIRLMITPPTSGPAPTSYTVWARDGKPASAHDIYLGQTTRLDFTLAAPPTNRAIPYTLLVRPSIAEFGDGPPAIVHTRPVVDRVRPAAPALLREAHGFATWAAVRDRQSGIGGYDVQQRRGSRWLVPKTITGRRLRLTGHGKVRVRSFDRAGNVSAWSRPVAY